MVYYEEGEYLCHVNEQGMEESKTGKPMIVFRFDPAYKLSKEQDGSEYQDPVQKDGNYDRVVRIVVDPENEQGMDFAMRKLRYSGFTGSTFAELDLTGKYIRCRCEYGDYNGKQVERWEMCLPPRDQKPLQPFDSKAARKLDALFGKRLKDGAAPKQERPQYNAGKHQPSVDAQRPAEPEELSTAGAHRSSSSIPDDEVPF